VVIQESCAGAPGPITVYTTLRNIEEAEGQKWMDVTYMK
jgi:hypothetical protein